MYTPRVRARYTRSLWLSLPLHVYAVHQPRSDHGCTCFMSLGGNEMLSMLWAQVACRDVLRDSQDSAQVTTTGRCRSHQWDVSRLQSAYASSSLQPSSSSLM